LVAVRWAPLLLLCCACGDHGWSREAALSASLRKLDRDGDGRVGQDEYGATRFAAPSLEQLDYDGDALLDPDELYELMRRQDPLSFDGFMDIEPPGSRARDAREHVRRVREHNELLLFLRAEILALDPAAPLPSSSDLVEFARDGAEGGAAYQALMTTLRADYQRLGMRFPDLDRGPRSSAAEH
jgi:hypothetical protein